MNSKINPRLLQEQGALLAQASRIQARASMFLASVSLIQEYMGLTQRLIALNNELAKNLITDGGTVPVQPQWEGPEGNSSGPCRASISGDQEKHQPVMG